MSEPRPLTVCEVIAALQQQPPDAVAMMGFCLVDDGDGFYYRGIYGVSTITRDGSVQSVVLKDQESALGLEYEPWASSTR